MTETSTMTLPLDWNEWRKEWRDWFAAHKADFKPTRKRFPGKNFLANETLGTWSVNRKIVELSELTFPNLSERDERGFLLNHDVRAIGITYGVGVDGSGSVVHSFEELERELGL